MIRGLYTAAAGMMLQASKQDIIANNIANVSSSGYKKDIIVSTAFPAMLLNRLGEKQADLDGRVIEEPPVAIGSLGTGAALGGVVTDFSAGYYNRTDNPLDLAIKGTGYFVLDTPQGNKYTRNGEFSLNNEGVLTSNNGYPVLDINNEHIYINGDFNIDNKGNISSQGQVINQIKVVSSSDPMALKKEGGNLIGASQPLMQSDNPEIIQGYLEESNVNAVSEMVNLISVVRSYEALQKMIQTEDDSLKTLIDEVGTVSA